MDFDCGSENQAYFSGNFESHPMKIVSAKGRAKAMSLFRSGIYSDKVYAVVREYICNAIDEHSIYCPTIPVEVTLDSDGFKVRDFGKGLDKKSIINVFGAFFESTRTSDQMGGYGLGSKSGHAYNDIFHITSYHEGIEYKASFVMEVVDGVDKSTTNITSVQASAEPSGIEVWVPLVEKNDEALFREKINTFAAMANFPIKFNGTLVEEKKATAVLNNKFFIYANTDLYRSTTFKVEIRMGSVVYRVPFDVNQKIIKNCQLVIDVPINTFPVPPSREVIGQRPDIIDRVNSYFEELHDEIIKFLSEKFKNNPVSKVDIYNVARGSTACFGKDDPWIERSVYLSYVKTYHQSEIEELEKIPFNKIKLFEYLWGSGRLKSADSVYLDSKQRMVLIDDIPFGEAKITELQEKYFKDKDSEGNEIGRYTSFLYVKTSAEIIPEKNPDGTPNPNKKKPHVTYESDFKFEDVPDKWKFLFIDCRKIVWTKRVVEKTDNKIVKDPNSEYFWAKFGKDLWEEKKGLHWVERCKGDHILKRYYLHKTEGHDESSARLLVKTKKAVDFFKSLGFLEFEEWFALRKESLLKQYRKQLIYETLLKKSYSIDRNNGILLERLKSTLTFKDSFSLSCKKTYERLISESVKELKTEEIDKIDKFINWVNGATFEAGLIHLFPSDASYKYGSDSIIYSKLHEQVKKVLDDKIAEYLTF